MWLRNAQRACCHARPFVAIPKRWAGRASPQRLLSPAFRQMGLLHSAAGTIRPGLNAGSAGLNTVEEAEVEESETLKVVDALFDHVAGESWNSAEQNASFRSRSSPSIMRDLSASPWLPSLTPQPSTSTLNKSSQAPPVQSEDRDKSKLDNPASKTMADSYTCFDLKLCQNPKILEKYLNTSGGLRIGLLLEHIDSLAGAIAYKHCLPALPAKDESVPAASGSANPLDSSGSMIGASSLLEASHEAGLYIATAAVDRLDLFQKLGREELQDLRFSGFCTYVGKSSMEVIVKLSGLGKDGNSAPHTLMLGRFSMVCRDAETHKARRVPALQLNSREEEVLFALGEDRKNRKKQSSMAALDRVPPTSDEVGQLHELMLQTQHDAAVALDGRTRVPMRNTELSSVILIQPQDRNLHGKAFGGLLMRLAFELAFVTCASFASHPMRFLSLDQISFKLPVPIGAILHLDAKVVKTTPADLEHAEDSPSESAAAAKAHVMVTAQVEDVSSGTRQTTNDFYFSFAAEEGTELRKMVIPQTYQEAMQFLEGGRRLEVAAALRRLYKA